MFYHSPQLSSQFLWAQNLWFVPITPGFPRFLWAIRTMKVLCGLEPKQKIEDSPHWGRIEGHGNPLTNNSLGTKRETL